MRQLANSSDRCRTQPVASDRCPLFGHPAACDYGALGKGRYRVALLSDDPRFCVAKCGAVS